MEVPSTRDDPRGSDPRAQQMDHSTFTLPPIPARVRRVLLFVAMRSEADPIAHALGARDGTACIGDAHIELLVPGADPVLGVDRLGPVHAASALARALAARHPGIDSPDIVVNMGTCGGFESQGLGIADLVVARDTMFHDARVALDGFDALARAHTRLSPSEAQLEAVAERTGARIGLASSGSSLDATADELALFRRTRTLAKDMELAALAVVCREAGVPLAALKGVTDLVDHHEPTHEAFLRNLARTTDRIAQAAAAFIEQVNPL
jgi:nucleoside phosphorylase